MNPGIFKAYDIRGVYPTEINELDVYKIATATCQFLKKENPFEENFRLVIGCDVRLSSPQLKRAALKAATDQKIKVIDIGNISTDMLYFAVAEYGYTGGFTITASHNPKEYNGMKIVRHGGQPISSDTGLFEIRDMAEKLEIDSAVLNEDADESFIEKKAILEQYAEKVRSFADFSNLKKLKFVANPNFGVGGVALSKITEKLDLEIIKLNYEPDGNFPKGRPDPLIPENQKEISQLVVEQNADFGVAWDADADRCFFFTEKGQFIEGYFITALLAKIFLAENKGEKIVHDTRLTWAIEDIIKQNDSIDVPNKAGHSFMKERMFKEKAIFGGEMSAHYFFRDYYFCDCGMIPLVMILDFLSSQTKTFSEIMQELFWNKYFVSGEINSTVADVPATVEKIKAIYIKKATKIDEQDGISLDFTNEENPAKNWRFSVRASNTEPLIRLNVEATSQTIMEQKRDELIDIIKS